jgi:DNA-binding transcriptional LysR family regulator
MEDDLKVTLVRRHSRCSRLTEEGKYILQRAYGVLDEIREIRSMVSFGPLPKATPTGPRREESQ